MGDYASEQPVDASYVTGAAVLPSTEIREEDVWVRPLPQFSNIPPLPHYDSVDPADYLGPTEESNGVLPGRILVGAYPSSLDDTLNAEILSSILRLGITTFVCLQQEYEHTGVTEASWRAGYKLRPYIYDAVQLLDDIEWPGPDKPEGLEFVHFPIVDCATVSDSRVLRLCKDLVKRLTKGENLYVHCWGGHGRTGTVISVMLGLIYNLPPDKAMEFCQFCHDLRACPMGVPSPQTHEQRAQVARILNGVLSRRARHAELQAREEAAARRSSRIAAREEKQAMNRRRSRGPTPTTSTTTSTPSSARGAQYGPDGRRLSSGARRPSRRTSVEPPTPASAPPGASLSGFRGPSTRPAPPSSAVRGGGAPVRRGHSLHVAGTSSAPRAPPSRGGSSNRRRSVERKGSATARTPHDASGRKRLSGVGVNPGVGGHSKSGSKTARPGVTGLSGGGSTASTSGSGTGSGSGSGSGRGNGSGSGSSGASGSASSRRAAKLAGAASALTGPGLVASSMGGRSIRPPVGPSMNVAGTVDAMPAPASPPAQAWSGRVMSPTGDRSVSPTATTTSSSPSRDHLRRVERSGGGYVDKPSKAASKAVPLYPAASGAATGPSTTSNSTAGSSGPSSVSALIAGRTTVRPETPPTVLPSVSSARSGSTVSAASTNRRSSTEAWGTDSTSSSSVAPHAPIPLSEYPGDSESTSSTDASQASSVALPIERGPMKKVSASFRVKPTVSSTRKASAGGKRVSVGDLKQMMGSKTSGGGGGGGAVEGGPASAQPPVKPRRPASGRGAAPMRRATSARRPSPRTRAMVGAAV